MHHSINALRQLVVIQFKEFFREPAILFWGFAFPMGMAWILGVAFSHKGDLVRQIAVVTHESRISSGTIWPTKLMAFKKRATSGEVAAIQDSVSRTDEMKNPERLEKIDRFEISLPASTPGVENRFRFVAVTREQSEVMIKRGQTSLILGESASGELEFRFDPNNPEGELAFLHLERHLLGDATNTNAVKSLDRSTGIVNAVTEKGSRYIDFLVPGLIALGMMNSCLWGIGWAMIDMRMKKLMRRIVATPLDRRLFLLAQAISRLFLSFLEAMVLLLFANYYFDIGISGSILAAAVLFLSGILAFAGIAICVSSRADNSRTANGLINAVTLPMFILSGVFFSYHNFPDWTLPVIRNLPLTMLADGLREVMIEGAGMIEIAPKVLKLGLTGLLTSSIGLKIYKWY